LVDTQLESFSWDFVINQNWQQPPKLKSFINIHPRVLLSGSKITALKHQITTTHKELWDFIQRKANSYIGQNPPSDFNDQEELRAAGRGIPWQALAFVLAGDFAHLDTACKWMLKICDYPNWGSNNSLAAGECLYCIALGYDWLYHYLSTEERDHIREKLMIQAGAMTNSFPVHYNKWLTNHTHVEHNGLAAAGFVLYDEVPDAMNWIRQADLVFKTAFTHFGEDGSSTEGHQYWAYSLDSILRYVEAANDLMGKDYYNNLWLENAVNFIISCTLPNFDVKNQVMTYGDSYRDYGSSVGYAGVTPFLYKFAAQYNNKYAQWLANEMFQRNIGTSDYNSWCSLLWYDENVIPSTLSDHPTFWHFNNTGWITSRSSWNKDAMMLGFKCGPFHGHKLQPYYKKQVAENWTEYHEIAGGHGHSDVNSMQIYAYGEWLAIDSGYEKPKKTRRHNTILVNGVGQLGEGKRWFDRDTVIREKATSTILKTETNKIFDYILGDAGNIYPKSTGLKKFYRHVVFIKPDFIITIDELETKHPTCFEWLLHSESGLEILSDNHCQLKNGDVILDVQFLLPETITTTNGDFSKIFTDEPTQNILIVSIKGNTKSVIITVLHPRKIDDCPGLSSLLSYNESVLNLSIQNNQWKKTVGLDLKKHLVEVTSMLRLKAIFSV